MEENNNQVDMEIFGGGFNKFKERNVNRRGGGWRAEFIQWGTSQGWWGVGK